MTDAGRPAAVILAGGAARRLGGGDKPLRMLAGEPMLARIARLLAPQAGPVALNANGDPARFSAFGLAVLADPVPPGPCGPLSGILAAMRWAQALDRGYVLSVPGDTPFLPTDLATRLAAAAAPDRVAVAASGERIHPAVALWPTVMAGELQDFLEAGSDYSVARFTGARQAPVHWPQAEAGGRAYDPFFNVNTREDLAEAEALARAIDA